MIDEESRADRIKEHQEWRAKTAFHPISDFSKIAADESVELPANGSYYIVANNLEEIKQFLGRIESLNRWERAEIVLDPGRDEWEIDWDEEVPGQYVTRAVKTLYINQYYPPDERLQVTTQDEKEVFVRDIQFTEGFLEEVTFPCLVQNSGDGGWDRIGDYEVNHCQILNLTGCPLREGPVTIHLRWI